MKQLATALVIFVFLFFGSAQAATYYCGSCAECTFYVQNYSGNTIKLNMSLSNFSSDVCINFSYRNNTIFDCQNFVISGNSSEYLQYGIYLSESYRNAIQNCRLVNFSTGVYVENSQNNTLSGIETNSSFYAFAGIVMTSSDYNTLSNIAMRDRISITSSNYTTITGLSVVNSQSSEWGIISFSSMENSTISNVVVSNCTHGISLYGVSDNTFTNITVSWTSNGLRFRYHTINNTIRNSRIENNQYGLYFGQIEYDVNNYYNLFYNNYFNNSVNIHYVCDTSPKNYFNTTKTLGINIVGGPYIGGNYWGNYTDNYWSDFSDNCTDSDSDGIYDSSHNVVDYQCGQQIYDYLPLAHYVGQGAQNQTCTESWNYSAWSDCANGVQVRSAWDANDCGTHANRSALTQSCYADIPGGAPSSQTNQTTNTTTIHNATANNSVTKKWVIVPARVNITVEVARPEICAMEVKVSVKNQANNVQISVTKLPDRPAEVIHEVSGKVYQYMEINKTNLGDDDIDNATIRFRVNKIWVAQNKIKVLTIALSRYHENTWKDLPTKLVNESDDEFTFEAETPGFSVFAVKAESEEEVAGVCQDGEKTCEGFLLRECMEGSWSSYACPFGCSEGKCTEPVEYVYAAIFISIGAVIAFVAWKYLRKPRSAKVNPEDMYDRLQREK